MRLMQGDSSGRYYIEHGGVVVGWSEIQDRRIHERLSVMRCTEIPFNRDWEDLLAICFLRWDDPNQLIREFPQILNASNQIEENNEEQTMNLELLCIDDNGVGGVRAGLTYNGQQHPTKPGVYQVTTEYGQREYKKSRFQLAEQVEQVPETKTLNIQLWEDDVAGIFPTLSTTDSMARKLGNFEITFETGRMVPGNRLNLSIPTIPPFFDITLGA